MPPLGYLYLIWITLPKASVISYRTLAPIPTALDYLYAYPRIDRDIKTTRLNFKEEYHEMSSSLSQLTNQLLLLENENLKTSCSFLTLKVCVMTVIYLEVHLYELVADDAGPLCTNDITPCVMEATVSCCRRHNSKRKTFH